MSPESNAAKAVACLESWSGPDKDTARARLYLHDDMTFRGPLGATDGADDYVAGLQGLSQAVSGAERHVVVADGDDVCVVYDLLINDQRLPTVGWYHFRDGLIETLRVFFDPRPLLG